MFNNHDEIWMQHALSLASKAGAAGEVPVGAVLVVNNEVIGEGYNTPIGQHDPTAHAEIIALRRGAEKIGNYRIVNATLYVTLEPCLMCAGAMVHARIKRLIYGAADAKAGAIVSRAQMFEQGFLNHHVEYSGGLLASACGQILSQFFKDRRDEKNSGEKI